MSVSVQYGSDAEKNITSQDFTKVSKYGDTMTGDLTITKSDDTPRFIAKNSNIDITGDNLPNSTQYDGIYFRDANDQNIGYCESSQTSAGDLNTDLVVRKGPSLLNRLRLGFDANGTRIVEVGSAQSAWLEALGLGETSETSTISNIISAASGATISSAAFAVWGKFAMLSVTFSYNSTISTTNVTIGTLVSGKRPVIAANAIASTGRLFGSVNTGGSVTVRIPTGMTDLPANNSITMRAVYLLA